MAGPQVDDDHPNPGNRTWCLLSAVRYGDHSRSASIACVNAPLASSHGARGMVAGRPGPSVAGYNQWQRLPRLPGLQPPNEHSWCQKQGVCARLHGSNGGRLVQSRGDQPAQAGTLHVNPAPASPHLTPVKVTAHAVTHDGTDW